MRRGSRITWTRSPQARLDQTSLCGLARRGNILLRVRLALAGRARGHQLCEHFLGRPLHRLGQASLLVPRALPRDIRPRILQVAVLDLRVRLLSQVREKLLTSLLLRSLTNSDRACLTRGRSNAGRSSRHSNWSKTLRLTLTISCERVGEALGRSI